MNTVMEGAKPLKARVLGAVLAMATVLSAGGFAVQEERGRATVITISETGQAAIAQPKIMFELRDARTGAPLRAAEDELRELLGAAEPLAFLDTGASSFIISAATAQRFELRVDDAGQFIETGMSGEHAMGVSIPYSLALTHHPRASTNNPRRDPRNPGNADIVECKSRRVLINRAADELTRLLGALGGAIDVIGMPAIADMMVEMQPQRAEETSVPVRLLTGSARPGRAGVPNADIWIPMEMIDFSRRKHPENRDPLPSLERNPVIPRVKVAQAELASEGDWLLDTGSAFTIISMKTAQAIGLFDAEGKPARAPDFQLPAAGISGRVHQLPGFRIDRIELKGEAGTTVIFERPFIVVHNVSTTLDDGRTVTLDGILGMNLLLNSGTGFNGVSFATTHASKFDSIIVDGRGARLGLTSRSE